MISVNEDIIISNARFNGLNQIQVFVNGDFSNVHKDEIVIALSNGKIAEPGSIHRIDIQKGILTVDIDVSLFARITSKGTTISIKRFGKATSSIVVNVEKSGETAVNGHILSSSQWTDEGWSTSTTSPDSHDSATGQNGLWRYNDITPNKDENERPVLWDNGNVTVPVNRTSKMLVLFVEFKDRLAENAKDYDGVSYKTTKPYLDFISGASKWYDIASYGQYKLEFVCPQIEKSLDWLMMDKNAADYTWDAQTHNMFAYAKDAAQKAYDKMGIKADDYDTLLIIPARGEAGLFNGPGNINRDPTDGAETNINQPIYFDESGKSHYIGTCITAGNDMFRWGYRWLIHEAGHTFGFPDTYVYNPLVEGKKISKFFWCGNWDMMGNISGQSTDYFGWHKWKLRWIRDDQVDVVSKEGTTYHRITPIETPGGSKLVVIRTGVSKAYVIEFRTKLGINALDSRGKYQGILLYRLDASKWQEEDTNYCMQVISKKYYNDPLVGTSRNLTGIWRPIDEGIDGLDSSECCFKPGDTFEDPASGVMINFGDITNYNPSDIDNSPYTCNDTAAVTITKAKDSVLSYPVVLSNVKLEGGTKLTFDTNIELQRRITDSNKINGGHYTYIREESGLTCDNLIITKKSGEIVPACKITKITVNPNGVEAILEQGTFACEADALGLSVSTKSFFYFAESVPAFLGTAPHIVVKDGMTQPVFDASKSIYERVFVEVPCDTDHDGKRDLVEVAIRRPKETDRGMKVPVIYEISPYFNKVGISPNHDVIVDQEINKDTSGRTYDDIKFKGMNAADWDADKAGVPKARVPEGRVEKGNLRDEFDIKWYEYFISRGYAVIYSASLGNFYGEGLEICGRMEDTLVAKTVIEWLCGKAKAYTDRTSNIEVVPEWCNGNVAMSGVSYCGTLPIAAACTGVEGLKTIIPVCGISSWYDSYRCGGAVIAPYGNQGEDVDSVAAFAFSRGLNEENYPKEIKERWKDNAVKLDEDSDRNTGDYNAFWDERNYLKDADKIKASVFIVAGLNDWNVKPKHFDELWRACRKHGVTCKMILSQGPHFPVCNLNGLEFMTKMNKWLDHSLYGIDNDWNSIPNVTMQSNKDLSWESFDTWPVNESSQIKYYFEAGNKEKTGKLSCKAPDSTVEKFMDSYLTGDRRSASPQNIKEWTNFIVGANNTDKTVEDRLLYMGNELTQDTRLSGTTKIFLSVSVNKGKGTLSAMLVDYGRDIRPLIYGSPFTEVIIKNGIDYGLGAGHPDIIQFKMGDPTDYKVVTRGWADVQNPNPSGKIYTEAVDTSFVPEYYYKTVKIKEGLNYPYVFSMEPMDYTFKKGHRMGIIIYSSDAEYSIIPKDKTEFTLNLGSDSYIEIPIKQK